MLFAVDLQSCKFSGRLTAVDVDSVYRRFFANLWFLRVADIGRFSEVDGRLDVRDRLGNRYRRCVVGVSEDVRISEGAGGVEYADKRFSLRFSFLENDMLDAVGRDHKLKVCGTKGVTSLGLGAGESITN